MGLRKRKNTATSRSYQSRWHKDGIPMEVPLGSTKKITKSEAEQLDRMIMSLVATKEADQSFDKKQIEFLANIPQKLHDKLERHELVRPRAARRSASGYTLKNLIPEFLKTKEVSQATIEGIEQGFGSLKNKFGADKDIREITPAEAKSLPAWIRKNARVSSNKPLADSTVNGHIKTIKHFFNWACSEDLLTRNVFLVGVKTNAKPQKDRVHYISLEQTQDLFNSMHGFQNLSLMVLARFFGYRTAADSVRIRNRDVSFADGDVNKAEVRLDSLKTGGRICPMFCDANWIIFKLLCDREPNPDGYLFKGLKFDRIRKGEANCDLSLASRFMTRYMSQTGKPFIDKLMTNCRSSWVTDLVSVFNQRQKDVGSWVGNTERIQDKHYLQIIGEEHAEQMANWTGHQADSKNDPENDPVRHGSYLSQMVFTGLQEVAPELVSVARKHAAGITKIGMHGMFPSTPVSADLSYPLRERGDQSSAGHATQLPNLYGKYRVGKLRGLKTTPKTTLPNAVSSVVPTLLAQMWNDLHESEQGRVEEVVLAYLQAQRDVIIE